MTAEPLPIEPPRRPRKDRDPKATERELLDLLEKMLTKPGNGGAGEYAFMRQVRNAAGFDAKRTFDGVSVGLWPSRGHDIHVYEVKVSRSDWQRELAHPQKAEDAAKVADRFSIVAPRDVVHVDDLPATWGLIHAIGGTEVEEDLPSEDGQLPRKITRVVGRKLRVVRKAPLLHPGREFPQSIPRTFLVPMLRAAGAVPDAVPATQQQIQQAVQEALRQERERIERDRSWHDKDRDEAYETLRQFNRLTGLYVSAYNVTESSERVKGALAAAHAPDLARMHVRRVTEQLQNSLAVLQSLVNEVPDDAPGAPSEDQSAPAAPESTP
jgi:hypothetical protein